MMSLLLLLATTGLIALPIWSKKRGAKLPPSEWVKLNSVSLASGMILLEGALIECAWPITSMLFGIPERHHFFPGGAVAGWVSLTLAVAMPASWLVGVVGALRRRRKLRAEPWVGNHVEVDGFDIVFLPSRQDLALALPGRPDQVLLSQSLFSSLSAGQLRAVIRHEIAHLEHGHSRYFLLVAALHPISRVVPMMRSSLRVLKLSLESWADRVACPTRAERQRVQEAIVALSVADVGVGVATLTDAERRHDRIRLLDDEPDHPVRLRTRTPLYLAELGFSLCALGTLIFWMV